MPLLADFFQIAIVLVCLIGFGIICQRSLPQVPFAIHFCFAPFWTICCLFFIEHYLGLGQWQWLWIPAFFISLWLIRLNWERLLLESVLWYFLLGFLACFFWRFSFPDLQPVYEMVPDLAHIVSYSAGTMLPPPDVWLRGSRDDDCFALQYYAAGLLHRVTGTGPGLTYHLAYCLLIAFATAGVGQGVSLLAKSRSAGMFAALALILGGNGATLITPFMVSGGVPPVTSAVEFVGNYAMPGGTFTPFGNGLSNALKACQQHAPMSYFAYDIVQGDFQPALSGVALFGLIILAIGVASQAEPGSRTDLLCLYGAISTAVMLIIGDLWVAPLQLAFVVGWLIYRYYTRRRVGWMHVTGAFLGSFALIFPYLRHFSQYLWDYPFWMVWSTNRPPILAWILVMFPALIVLVLTGLAARRNGFARLICGAGLLLLLTTYFVTLDDGKPDPLKIADTTNAWWPWSYAFVITLGLASIWRIRSLRLIGGSLIFLTMVGNTYIMGHYYCDYPKAGAGHLDGYTWFTGDGVQGAIFQQLKALPPGIVLESSDPNAPDCGNTLALFSGQYSLGGWTNHELASHPGRIDLRDMATNRDNFYLGKLDDPVAWLKHAAPGGVDYIVWLNRDNDRSLDIWAKLNDKLKDQYDWHPTREYNLGRWGMWIKRSDDDQTTN